MRNVVSFDCGNERNRLEAAAAKTGKPVSVLLRQAVRNLLDHLESGGKLERLTVPPDVEDRLRAIERAVAGAKGPQEELIAAVSEAHAAIDRLAELLKLDMSRPS